MVVTGDKVRQISGYQEGTHIGGEYEVVASTGDPFRTISGHLCDEICEDGEFFLVDDDGDIRYQVFPDDAFTGWEKVS